MRILFTDNSYNEVYDKKCYVSILYTFKTNIAINNKFQHNSAIALSRKP